METHGDLIPPINEIGFSVLASGTLVDPYDIRGLHDLVRAEYPWLSRQLPAVLEAEQFAGLATTISENDTGLAPRWWFENHPRNRLIQVQERYIGWNWRKMSGLYGEPQYPGFENCLDEAMAAIDSARTFREKYSLETGAGLVPAPTACQLLYDNIIVLQQSDRRLRISDILNFFQPVGDPVKSFGWNFGWVEPIDASAIEDGDPVRPLNDSMLKVEASMLAAIDDTGTQQPVLRLRFVAYGVIQNWDSTRAFFTQAHAHITATLSRITTDQAKAAWGIR